MSIFIPPTAASEVRKGLTLEAGEQVYDTDEKRLYIGDGVTAGGNKLYTATDVPIVSEDLTIYVGSTRSVKTIGDALNALKKYAFGAGVGANIILDAGNYIMGSSDFTDIACDLEVSRASGAAVSITDVVISNTNRSLTFSNITFVSRVECYSGVTMFDNCTFNHMLRASYGAQVFLTSPTFTGESTVSAIDVRERSFVRIEGGSITGYATGISATQGSYVLIPFNTTAVTFTNCTTRENPVANTVGNDNSYIKDPAVTAEA